MWKCLSCWARRSIEVWIRVVRRAKADRAMEAEKIRRNLRTWETW